MRFKILLILVALVVISGCTVQSPIPTSVAQIQTEQPSTTLPTQTPECSSNWQCGNWTDCSRSGLQTRTCADVNNCGTASNKPTETQSCTPPCTPNWKCTEWSSRCSALGDRRRVCSDSSNCGTIENKPPEAGPCVFQTTSGPEPLVLAVNKNYADKTPDWQERADKAIENVNKVFLKTTKREYKISKYLVYEDTNYEKVQKDPDFYTKWGELGGVTIFLLVHKNDITIEELKKFIPSNNPNSANGFVLVGETTYQNILLAEPENYNILLSKGELGDYWKSLVTLLHELGHTNGLAVPEWYLYSYEDCTKTQPLLPKYNIKDVHPEDPMTSSNKNEYQFSKLNSEIINRNLDHRYDWSETSMWYINKTKVYVTDSVGVPVGNADVKIFCVRKGCVYCKSSCNGESGVVDSISPEAALQTDSSGYVDYSGPSGNTDFEENENTECLAKAIKVSYQGKTGAKYVNFLDLQEDYILQNKTVHIDHITIK